MPIYEYRCKKCNAVEEMGVSISQRDAPMKHACGGLMMRLLSLPLPAIIARTGKGMALDSLNSDRALPNRWYKKKYEEYAKAGLHKPPKRVW
jgi:putative FmdB family regulatory protein